MPPPGGMPMPGPGQGIPIPIQLPPGMKLTPGQQPTPEQIEIIKKYQVEAQKNFQAKIAEQAEKEGVPVQEVLQRVQQQMQQQRAAMMARAQAQQQQQAQQQAQQQQAGGQPGGQGQPQGPRPAGPPQQAGVAQPITPGPPNPVAIAMANFLRGQELKPRTCILNGERKDMFRGTQRPCPSPGAYPVLIVP